MELLLENVSKTYGRKDAPALGSFSFAFRDGVYGLLGPNGAGKSTLMNILTQNITPDGGCVRLDGTDIKGMGSRYRSLIGYAPQEQELYRQFSGWDFLWYMAALKGLAREEAQRQIETVTEVLNMGDFISRRMGGYSGGMRQRVLIAQALLGDPKILIMDEPTAGLDPEERVRIQDYIGNLSRERIVLIATHIVPDVEIIADHVLFLDRGRLIRSGAPSDLLKELSGQVYTALCSAEERKLYENGAARVLRSVPAAGGQMLRLIAEENPKYGKVEQAAAGLEDLYMYLFG